MITAGIYGRVSTVHQHTENQLPELNAFCLRQDWKYVEYMEAASGKQGSKRPVLAKLLQDATDGKIQVVVCWKMDRFGRSIKDFIANIEVLNKAGCRFICTSQPIDTDQRSPFGKMLMSLLMVFAEFERDLIAERIQLGVARSLSEQAAAEKAGVQRFKRKGLQMVELLPHGRPRKVWARGRAAELAAGGMSVRKIAAELGTTYGAVRRAIKANT